MKLKPSDFDWEKYDYTVEVAYGIVDRLTPHGWATKSDGYEGIVIKRAPKPKPIYQLLTPGMELREGDELRDTSGNWEPVISLVGFVVLPTDVCRRKLPEGTKLP